MDHSISDFFVEHRPQWIGDLADTVTLIGQFPIGLIILLAVGLALRKRVEVIGIALLAGVLAYGLNSVIKRLIERGRPPESNWFSEAHGYSMPSGHAINSAVLGTFLFLWLPNRWRWIGVVVAITVAWSRVELGVHWPSDVVIGGAIGCSIALAGHWLTKRASTELI